MGKSRIINPKDMREIKKKKTKAWTIISKHTKTIENLDLIYWLRKDVLERKTKMRFPKDWKVVPIKIILNP